MGFKCNFQFFGIHNNENQLLYRLREYRPRWEKDKLTPVTVALHYSEGEKSNLTKERKAEIKALLNKYHRGRANSTTAWTPSIFKDDEDYSKWPSFNNSYPIFPTNRQNPLGFYDRDKSTVSPTRSNDAFHFDENPSSLEASDYVLNSIAKEHLYEEYTDDIYSTGNVEDICVDLLRGLTRFLDSHETQMLKKLPKEYIEYLEEYRTNVNPYTNEIPLLVEDSIEEALDDFTLVMANHIIKQAKNNKMAKMEPKEVFLTSLYTVEAIVDDFISNGFFYETVEEGLKFYNKEYENSLQKGLFIHLLNSRPLEKQIKTNQLIEMFMEIK